MIRKDFGKNFINQPSEIKEKVTEAPSSNVSILMMNSTKDKKFCLMVLPKEVITLVILSFNNT